MRHCDFTLTVLASVFINCVNVVSAAAENTRYVGDFERREGSVVNASPIDNALLRAEYSIMKKNYGEAIMLLEKSADQFPKDEEIKHALSKAYIRSGDSLLKQNDVGGATLQYRKAVNIDPSNRVVIEKLENLEVAADPKLLKTIKANP